MKLFDIAFKHAFSLIRYTLQDKVSPIFLIRDRGDGMGGGGGGGGGGGEKWKGE